MGNLLILKAVGFAAGKHRDQRRKGVDQTPYINHPLQVALLIYEIASVEDVEILAAAILHDTVEDTKTTHSEIEEHFGPRISGIVREVTDDKSLPKEECKRLQVEHARELSEAAALIKIADKICNVTDITNSPPVDWDDDRRNKYFDWAESVVSSCPRVSEALDRRFQEMLLEGRKLLNS